MDQAELRRTLSRLGRHAFSKYVYSLFNSNAGRGNFGNCVPLPDAGEDVFALPYLDSYGSSIHNVYLLHFPPIELFRPATPLDMSDPVLLEKLHRVRDLYKGKVGQWGMVSPVLKKTRALQCVGFITNFCDVDQEIYQRTIMPAYSRLKNASGLKKATTLIGSIDSFIDKRADDAIRTLATLLQDHKDGIAIQIGPNKSSVTEFGVERNLRSGVISEAQSPYEPIFIQAAVANRHILAEFDRLLESDALEKHLEDFLTANYKLLFGYSYDRIETQLWLRCPDLDIAGKDRRVDLFLRNSTTNDWELFELKRATIPLIGKSTDVPTISAHLNTALQQTRNYARTLGSDKVRRHFAQRGIEYFEPELRVVIGRTPSIPHDQWRWLKTSHETGILISTYDELRKDLSSRLEDRHRLLESMQLKNQHLE